jgi:hypothetical protein
MSIEKNVLMSILDELIGRKVIYTIRPIIAHEHVFSQSTFLNTYIWMSDVFCFSV